ncbi:YecA family protein [Sphingobacterium faecium]|uniref:YecA family protein n=1 Tax=Sphingobacterium faecium TaxID=34087 RepID=UPI003DA318FF
MEQRFSVDDFRDSICLCQNCSAIFKIDFKSQFRNLPNIIEGIPDMTLSGNCPNCNYPELETKNNLYEFVEDTFQYLKSLNLPQLIILDDALSIYRKSFKTREDNEKLNKVINDVAPQLFNIRSFIPKTSADLAAWIGIVFTILFGVIQLLKSDETSPKTVIFNNINNTQIIEPAIVIDSSKIKSGRNDQCPCGSGIKFKKCHGLNKR